MHLKHFVQQISKVIFLVKRQHPRSSTMVYEVVERTEPTTMKSNSSKIKMSKFRMVKNIIVVCIGVFILFLSYTGVQFLQSTINKQEGIGVASQAIILAVTSICSLLIPEYFIKRFGSKTIFSVSIILYIPYILANFYPHWEVLIPTSILNGIGVSLLWSSSATYLNDLSIMLAECMYSEEDLEKELPKLLPNFDSIIGVLADDIEDDDACSENDCALPAAFVYITGRKRTYSDVNVANIRRQSALTLSLRRNSFTNEEQLTARRSSAIPIMKINSVHKDQRYSFTQRQSLDENRQAAEISTFEQSLDFDEKKKAKSDVNVTFKEMELKDSSDDNIHDTNTKDIKNVDAKKDPDLALACKKIYIEAITSRVFGIFGMAFLSTIFWSNLISFFIIGGYDFIDDSYNFTCNCGTKFCQGGLICINETLADLEDEKRYIYFSVCTLLAVISFIFVFFLLDNLDAKRTNIRFSLQRLLATYEFSKNIDSALLILCTLNTGMSTGFFLGDFTQAYSGCAFGINHVTLSSACYGLCCAVSSSASGWLIKYADRKRVFSVAFVLNFTTNVTLLVWEPNPEHVKMLYILSGIYGINIGIIWSQTRALYGIFFKENQEAAFSAYYVWYSLGLCLSLAISGYFCIFEKMCALLVVSIIGFIGYVIVEKRHKRKYFMK
ncbi:protein unc-93 homolog A-like [Parasteatoda tepidariorum]|uniref:protein unc-93 homolog A-like n=1 Tax=Parasteatoda tepidariorum TaxID=114398 RepID=UPI0039BD8D9F